jgi:sphinganine C4-monooxygenase
MALINTTSYSELPPLPSYELKPLPPLLPWVSDTILSLLLPIIAYWGVSMLFHLIDVYDLFPQYRLHTPAELLTRNHVSRWDVLRDVIIQQIIQTIFGLGLSYLDAEALCGKEEYDVAMWARRIRAAERAVPIVLGLLGVNSAAVAKSWAGTSPTLAGVLAGGQYPTLQQTITVDGQAVLAPAFANWELVAAKAAYYVLIPALQFVVGILIVDTWQYFWHRAMHMNKWLYSMHPRLIACHFRANS